MLKRISLFICLFLFISSQTRICAQSPGNLGTSTLTTWFKADSLPVGNVLTWRSSFPSGAGAINFTDTTGAPYPQATDTCPGLNYNNVITFAGNSASNILTLGKLGAINYINNNLTTNQSTLVMVYYLPTYTATGGHMLNYHESAGDGIQFRHLGTVCRNAIGSSNSVNASRDYTEDYKPMIFSYSGSKSGASTLNSYKRSLLVSTAVASASTGDNGITLGARLNTGTYTGFYEGYIGEFMMYNSAFSITDLNKIHSYLAIKYGITLDNTGGGSQGNYTAPNGKILWNAAANPAYHNNVIGIGREDSEGLSQRQAHTLDDSTRLYIGSLGSGNLGNFGAFYSDSSYILIGSNNGKLASTTASNSEKPLTGIYSRIEREWKLTNTNFTTYFSVDVKLDAGANLNHISTTDLCLLVSYDGNFTNAVAYNYLTGLVFSYTSGVVTISNMGTTQFPMDSTMYFTLGSTNVLTPLPVKYADINASRNKGTVMVSWNTLTEINNDHFNIERSVESGLWEDIGLLKSIGSPQKNNSYEFIDENPPAEGLYYRVKQTDKDGKFSYTKSVYVSPAIEHENNLLIYPSPANEQISVNSILSSDPNYRILNMLGQNQTEYTEIEIEKDDNTILNINRLSPGIYILCVQNQRILFIKN